MRRGWDTRYKIWVEHGEPAPPMPPPVIDNTRQPQMCDMTALLNDLSYIPPNNKHNEPTQGDIGKTSNEQTQATRNEFEELYASANEERYPGCDYVTRLDFMAKFTYFKVKGRLTYYIFNEMLEFFQNVFPISKGFKLPPSYYAIKKIFKMIGLGYESIHACEYDYCLFRRDNNKYLDFCPVCNTSRWKDSNTPGKKVPKKVLRYFPIIPRLQRLYKSSHTAKEMIWHATGKCTEPGKMQHPVDGSAWKKFDTKYPDFAKEPRNVRLGLAADGFNPFENLSQAYNMWPVILITYNLPPWLCMKESSFMPTLLIPGPKSPGKDIDVYLRPWIEDLKTINDFPARSSLSGWSRPGYKACPTCNEDTPSVRVLSKTTYVGHRRFLKKPHKWRHSLEFNGQTDNRDPSKEFSRDVILAQLDRLPKRVKGKHLSYVGVKIKRNIHVELNWTKWSIFYELEYWSFVSLRHNLDIMHIGKNVLEAILNTFLMNDKSKDTAKARQDLKILGIRSGLWLGQTKNGKCLKPQAAYSFTPENQKKFCQYIKGVKLPDGFGSCFKHKQICSATLMEDDMLKAQIKVVDIRCDLKLIYPLALFDIMVHLVILPLEALEGELIRPRWMFPFERYMKKIKVYFLTKTCKENSPDGLRVVADNDQDPEVSTTNELFALANGPSWTSISVNSCVVDGVSLNDLDNATLHIDGQSTVVDAPPDIIDVPDEDDDIINDEDALPHDLTDSDVEDLINVDDDGVEKMSSADVAQSHGGDSGGDDRPPSHVVPTGCGGCFANKGKGKRKPQFWAGLWTGRLNTRDKDRNLSSKGTYAEAKAPSSIN
ncbi:hypothetical protein Tco_0683207 [Tanacetum coccineum]|uniref:DUF4218 domain-containing protein n=1 Tax=Tanacetum coccineum TaxID=301880 RepID=A0ABQ4XTG7_9ASTR